MSLVRTTVIQIVDRYNKTLKAISIKKDTKPTTVDKKPGSDFLIMVFILTIVMAMVCSMVATIETVNSVLCACFVSSFAICVCARMSNDEGKVQKNKMIDRYVDTGTNIYANPEKAALYGARHNSRQISLKPVFDKDDRVTDFYTKGIMTMDERIINVIEELITLNIEAVYQKLD